MATKEELYDTAVDLFGEGKLDEAIVTYKEALAVDPGFVDALHGLAMAYAGKQLLDEAIEVGKRIVELTPDDVLAHTSLSMFYQQKGMVPEAEAEGATARMLDWKRQLQDAEGGKKDGS
jgi:tetratricopeptide (TPR) repeat protein